jgi:hypothetical protein
VHGLFEFYGQYGKTWRLKDLYDIYLILKHKSLDMNLLTVAIQTAFHDRKTPLTCYNDVLENKFGQSGKRQRAWRRLNQKWSERTIHASHLPLLSFVRQFLDPIFLKLLAQ